jgi:SAM-dependent methyltransferase
MSGLVFKVPQELRRGNKRHNEEKSVAQGVELIKLMCRNFGIANFGESSVLDMGCGCKLVQAILDRKLPLGRYVGVDVFPDLINFLNTNVTDPRFSFHVYNTHNEMYNPHGEPLSANTRLPLDEHSFDFICLFSVFTHLAPHDYVAMLKMLRRYIKPGGKLIFSLFVNELTQGGHGHLDKYNRDWENAKDNRLEQHKEAFVAAAKADGPPDFLDFYPAQPLKCALYSRENALRLVENTGWEIESLNDPEECIQHYMICKPV